MGLYLCVFDTETGEEFEGVEVGSYDDFFVFRNTISVHLEGGVYGSRFPVLLMHSDCDGEWSPDDARKLASELTVIGSELAALAPIPLPDGWKRTVARQFGISPKNLNECFFDIDGEPLLARLEHLCGISIERGLPILFQ